MIEKDECRRAILRERHEFCKACGRCGEGDGRPSARRCTARHCSVNDPKRCRGAWERPPKVELSPERSYVNYAAFQDYHVDVPCEHDSAEACPWWPEREEHQRQNRARWLGDDGFPLSNRYPDPELLPPDIAGDVLRYVREFEGRERKANVVISGPVGAGKTSTSAHVVAELRKDAHLVPAADLFDGLQKQIDSDLRTVDILIVDDLGTEIVTPVSLQNWHRIVDERYDRGLATIVTTNVEDVDSLFQDERTRSRFMARCEVWRTTRKDVRRWMEERDERARREAEVDAADGDDG